VAASNHDGDASAGSNRCFLTAALPVRRTSKSPTPSIERFGDAEAEHAHLVATIRRLTGEGIAAEAIGASEIAILVHPECRPDVAKLADAVLSTSGMVRYAKEKPAKRFLVVTECGLSDRLAMEVPDKQFLKGCKLCTFMKVTTLPKVLSSLQRMEHRITVPAEIASRARLAIERMIAIGGQTPLSPVPEVSDDPGE